MIASVSHLPVDLLQEGADPGRIVACRHGLTSGLDQPLPEAALLTETADGGAELSPVSGQEELATVIGLEAARGFRRGDHRNAARPGFDDLHSDARGDAQGNHKD